ncbi:MAG: pitrilysin family protein [Candidatus Sumerlaeia bacterium]
MARLRTLPNGIRIVSEPMKSVRSCGIGIWIDVGSRHESEDDGGLSHFVEHMLFKGTRRLTTKQIADVTNELGGNINAFTTQEQLVLHARTIDVKAPRALDLLGEMLIESVFPDDELARERQVILEECKMYEDSPEELSVDVFMRNLWPDHPLGRPVIGRRSTIRRFNAPYMREFWRHELQPKRILIAIAGAFSKDDVEEVVRRRFAPLRESSHGHRPAQPSTSGLERRQSCLKRTIEQTHFCLGTNAPRRRDPERYAFGLLNMILGGGVSSRLFQEVREKRGLAYSIGSFTEYFTDAGSFGIDGATSPSQLGEVLRITLDEIERICEERVSDRELELARSQVIDGLLIGLENTESRMMRNAESILTFGRVLPVDEVIGRVEAVDASDVQSVARRYLRSGALAVSCVGPTRPTLPEPVVRWPGRL